MSASASADGEIMDSESPPILKMNLNEFREYAGNNNHSTQVNQAFLSVLKLCEHAVVAQPVEITDEMMKMDRFQLPQSHKSAWNVYFGSKPEKITTSKLTTNQTIPEVTQAPTTLTRKENTQQYELARELLVAKASGIDTTFVEDIQAVGVYQTPQEVTFVSEGPNRELACDDNLNEMFVSSSQPNTFQGPKQEDEGMEEHLGEIVQDEELNDIQAVRTYKTLQEVIFVSERPNREQACDDYLNEMFVSSSQPNTFQGPKQEDEEMEEHQHEIVQNQERNERQNENANVCGGKDLNMGPAQERERREECQHEISQEPKQEEYHKEIETGHSPVLTATEGFTSPLQAVICDQMEVGPCQLLTSQLYVSALDFIQESPVIPPTQPTQLSVDGTIGSADDQLLDWDSSSYTEPWTGSQDSTTSGSSPDLLVTEPEEMVVVTETEGMMLVSEDLVATDLEPNTITTLDLGEAQRSLLANFAMLETSAGEAELSSEAV